MYFVNFRLFATPLFNNSLQPVVTIPVRTILRNNWPRPGEVKRVRKLGWKARMKTASGRKIIMNRILKGTWILTH